MKLNTLLIFTLLIASSWSQADEKVHTRDNKDAENLFEQEYILEKIYCRGNTTTKCSLIKNELWIKPGSRIHDRDLQNSKIRLQLLGLFDSVELNLKKGSGRGKVNLEVNVKEGTSLYTVFDLGLGLINRDLFSQRSAFRNDLQFTLGTRNLFGLGKRLSATVYTQDAGGLFNGQGATSTSFRYTDPNIFGSRRLFYNFDYVSVRKLYESNGFSSEGVPSTRELDIHGQLFQLEFGLRFRRFSYFTLGYAVSDYRASDIFMGGVEERYESKTNTHYVVFGLGVNTQNDLYFPTSGSRFEIKFAAKIDSRNQDFLPISNGRVDPSEIEWRTTWQLKPKFYLTGFLEGRTANDNSDLVNNGLGLEFAHQARQNQTFRDVSDLRFFITPSIAAFSDFDDYGPQIALGAKLRSKKFGMARFQFFLRDDR